MIALRTCLTFALVFFVLPYGVGCLAMPREKSALPWIFGLGCSFAVYEALSLIFHLTLGSLRVMTALWCVLYLLAASGGFYRRKRQVREPHGVALGLARDERILLGIAVALVAAQTLLLVFSSYYGNWDDQTYCANAVTSWYTDTLNRYAPESGFPKPAFYDPQYVVPGWTSFCASLAVLTGAHPAIVYRTLLPLVELPAAYGILYLLAAHFFKDKRKHALTALILVEVFVLLAAERAGADAAPEWWLVINCWSGKALAANIVTPLVLWLVLQLEDAAPAPRRALWITLAAVCWGCTLISATLYFVVPVELAFWGGFYLLRTKRWKEIPLFVGVGLACVGMAVVCL